MGYRRQGFPNSIIHPGWVTYNLPTTSPKISFESKFTVWGMRWGGGTYLLALNKSLFRNFNDSHQLVKLISFPLFQVCCHPKKNGRRWRKTALTRRVCPGSLGTRGPSPVPQGPSCPQGRRQCLLLRRARAPPSQLALGETWLPSPALSRNLSLTCPSAGLICSNMPSFQMTAPTDVLSVKRSRYLRASRTSTASNGTRSSITKASLAKCSHVRSAQRSSQGRIRWSSTLNKSTTVLSPSLKPLPPLLLILSLTLSSALAIQWPLMPSLVAWRTLRTTCTSWSARWPATLPTSRAQEVRGQADGRPPPVFFNLRHKIFGNHGGLPRHHRAKFKIRVVKDAFSKSWKIRTN